ncbi:alpha/beta fold hydrolase [Marixanthomonas sp. SCSIO 43207]|uniref:alpha/beta fold hydrolase n=1 Tax=Marixanthomonas sp. SCSIO 43207 TaxID=2779360 RepID=UPI001CA9E4F7|nr:alpha/beta fold hydrolase [Marixanthomonas sp. SCSIO 43207]UAB80650.1 alpha/beta fold hydrolase [Marixanthomonas sp. SCSIO 43207]
MKTNYLLIILTLITFSAFTQTEKVITSEDTILCYTTFNSEKGNPILIINGGPGMSSEGFISLAESLSEENQTIIYDQRGTGKSTLKEINSETITLDLMVEDIEVLRKHLKIDSWVVLGHSFGGMLASYYTTKHPDIVDGLILSASGGVDLSLLSRIDITGRLSATDLDSLQYWNRKIEQGDTTYTARLQRGTFLASAYVYNEKFVPKIAKRLTQGNRRINRLVWQNMHQIQFDCKQELKKFKKPVLIIQGKQDIVHPEIAKTTHKLLDNSKLVYIDKCAHYGWLEQPDDYFKEINSFLRELAS